MDFSPRNGAMGAMEDDSGEIVQRLFANLRDLPWAEDFAVARL
jgi:hypothetical protein